MGRNSAEKIKPASSESSGFARLALQRRAGRPNKVRAANQAGTKMTDFETVLLEAYKAEGARPIFVVSKQRLEAALACLGDHERAWSKANGFTGKAGRILVLPDGRGGLSGVLFGLGDEEKPQDPFLAGKLARELPDGVYALSGEFPGDARLAALAWLLDSYRFDRYRTAKGEPARLACPPGVDRQEVLRTARAVGLVRDLVNTPALDMGPDELEARSVELAKSCDAAIEVVSGEALAKGFPLIHTVGAASPRAPRLIDIRWGNPDAPKVTLVGKGVCFDTGGLDIKPSSGMALMKKDMGGAANVLGLAAMIMEAALPVRLRVLIPAVDNAISGNAFRPGDVIKSRKGLTVEIGNTDAEGRLVLADALAFADEEAPDLLVDLATLTGAARVALGPDLPALYTDDEELARSISDCGAAENDPVWRLPLWGRYEKLFESRIADLNNAGNSSFAGSITAALFLRRFVEKARSYAHFDIFAWTPEARPGRPFGGEAQVIRGLSTMIRARYNR